MTAARQSWTAANHRCLAAELAVAGLRLERHAARLRGETIADDLPAAEARLAAAVAAMPQPSALDGVCAAFDLTAFEREVLLLAAGLELDSRFAPLLSSFQADAAAPPLTFSLTLALSPAATWAALTPTAPLRQWRLIDVGPGPLLTTSPLRVAERVLHHLAGVSACDPALAAVLDPVPPPAFTPDSHRDLADAIARGWADGPARPVQLLGPTDKRGVAAAACDRAGFDLWAVHPQAVPTGPAELDAFLRLCEREAALGPAAFLLDAEALDGPDALRAWACRRFAEQFRGPLVLTARDRPLNLQRPTIVRTVPPLTKPEQRAVWGRTLGDRAAALNGQVDRLLDQFSLDAGNIATVGAELDAADDDLGDRLWAACRRQARPRLDGLAERIESHAGWDDLVLPPEQEAMLRQIAGQVRQRSRVYDTWGFAAKGGRGLGLSALFAGPSGTGKTLAAEVLANELRLDLYRIDLSQVVSKYIGETEKNLRAVFDAAEGGSAVLLFDEADALFGKRSEVKDSHDRYANIEISYLLQRMEAYRGLAVLTTNLKNVLDPAFLRRLRFVVTFPVPDAAHRARIWRRAFPPDTPTDGLSADRLARLSVTGGNIRTIALNAAFLAADAGEPVRMAHVRRAAEGEYAKLEKHLTEVEIGGWT